MPRVFISYSHEESEHNNWVVELAKLLRKNGIDANLDEWDLLPGKDVTYFMESLIRDSDFVVLVCTPLYAEKSNISRGGVGYEKNIISAEMLQASDLHPKFIPILRKGDHDNALPTYLGSKYAIDFRDTQNQTTSFDELLRAIYKQPHPEKPPLGNNPFQNAESSIEFSTSPQSGFKLGNSALTSLDQDIDVWEKEALGRFEYLCSTRLNKDNPFNNGFWQASFVLLSKLDINNLNDFLRRLRESETGRTGWDVGWVPTRVGIAPYPYQNGIEVWLAEDGDKGPGQSDFWRAERSGRFVLFRGYQEDEPEFQKRLNINEKIIDFSLVLWRITEFLLYLESFSKKMSVGDSKAKVKVTWNGLENRRIGYHKGFDSVYGNYMCRQPTVNSTFEITSCSEIRKNLIKHVHIITTPLFEMFNFFSITQEQIKNHIKKLFDPEKEGII